MTELDFLPATPDPTRPEREPRKRAHRHHWTIVFDVPFQGDHAVYVTGYDRETNQFLVQDPSVGQHHECSRCGAVQDPARSRRGRQSRNYGNRAELDIARKHGGRKVGHAGGPADVLGATRKLQVKSTRRRPPAMWRDAFAGLDSIADSRLAVLLLRFVRAGNLGPEDFYVVRAADFLAWYGIDGEATP